MRSHQLLARLIDKLRRIPQPVIAAVQGPAAGAGLAIALAADVRVALRASSFSAAFVRLGLTGTDMGTSFFMPRLAGLGVASEALLTGRAVPAERAYALGLVNQLADSPAELEAAARGLAHDMLRCSPVGLQLTKEQLNAAAEGGSLRAALTAENSHQMLLVNQPAAQRLAKDWVEQMVGKGAGRGGGGSGGGGGGGRAPSCEASRAPIHYTQWAGVCLRRCEKFSAREQRATGNSSRQRGEWLGRRRGSRVGGGAQAQLRLLRALAAQAALRTRRRHARS